MKKSVSICIPIIVTVLLFSCSEPTPKKKVKRPNIVFIMSDDHAYQAISAYDTTLIRTPHIDRLAKEGMLFTNASVTKSICAPSRAVILTGKHSHINGKIDNLSPFDTTNTTFPMLLQKAGYQTAMFGKLHFGNNPKGFDEFKILPGQGDYYNPKFITQNGDTTITGYVTDITTDLTLDWQDHFYSCTYIKHLIVAGYQQLGIILSSRRTNIRFRKPCSIITKHEVMLQKQRRWAF